MGANIIDLFQYKGLKEITEGYGEEEFTNNFLDFIVEKASGKSEEEQKHFVYAIHSVYCAIMQVGYSILTKEDTQDLNARALTEFEKSIVPSADLEKDLGLNESHKIQLYESICERVLKMEKEKFLEQKTVRDCIEYIEKQYTLTNSKSC